MEVPARQPGDVAEVGVYRGGSAGLLARLLPDRTLHLFDTFVGTPAIVHELDNHHKAGDFADTSLGEVKAFLADHAHVRFHPGLFPETAQALTDYRFILVHVDCDLYRSVRACCEFFYPRMVPGGVMVFDDYREATCLGAKAAVDEFFVGRPDKPVLPPGEDGGCFVGLAGEE